MTNNGPSNATNVVIEDIVPGQFNITGTSNSFNGKTTINLNAGASYTITINATALIAGTWNNTANATCDENKTIVNDTANVTVDPAVNLTINKTANPNHVHVGDTVVFTINVTNNGPSNATQVTIEDILPKQFKFETSSDSRYNETNNIIMISQLTPGASYVFTITAKALISGIWTNTANASCAENKTVIEDDATVIVDPIVDLSTNKSSDKEEYFVDDIAYWTITVHNAANGTNATNVTLKETFPDQFEFIDYTATEGTQYDHETGIWNIGFMENGTSVTLTIKSRAKGTGEHITNIANVTCNVTDWNLTNNVNNKTVKIVPLPDPIKTVSNSAPYFNDIVEYYLTIENIGNSKYTNNLTVIDSLPEGVSFIERVSIKGADLLEEKVDGSKITWIVTNILGKSNATIVIKAKVQALGKLTNNLTIIGPDGTNSTVNCTIDPIPIADLEITKKVSQKTAYKNDKITWTITVTNKGPNTAVDAIVTDKLPAGLVYYGDDSNGAYDHRTGIWNVGNLLSGQTAELNIVTIVKTTNKSIVNLANVGSNTYDPNKANNYANNSVYISPEVDLALTISQNDTKVYVGEKIEFVVTVVNNGPDTAVNTRAFIKIPEELKLLGFTPSKGSYDPETGIWTIGDLAPGEKVTLTLQTKALETGIFTISGITRCDTYERDLSNNNDSAVVEVIKTVPPIDYKNVHSGPKLPATGNPIAMVLLSLLAIVAVTLRRKS